MATRSLVDQSSHILPYSSIFHSCPLTTKNWLSGGAIRLFKLLNVVSGSTAMLNSTALLMSFPWRSNFMSRDIVWPMLMDWVSAVSDLTFFVLLYFSFSLCLPCFFHLRLSCFLWTRRYCYIEYPHGFRFSRCILCQPNIRLSLHNFLLLNSLAHGFLLTSYNIYQDVQSFAVRTPDT